MTNLTVEQIREALDYILATVAAFLVFCFVMLGGCSSEQREWVLDTDECLRAEKRAVMLCTRGGRCYIECREPLTNS